MNIKSFVNNFVVYIDSTFDKFIRTKDFKIKKI